MTPGVTLKQWQRQGLLERELQLYIEYVRRGWRVIIGGYDNSLEGIALPTGIEFSPLPHRYLLPFLLLLRPSLFSEVSVVKINQPWRSFWYVIAAKLKGCPVLIRCGWLPGASWKEIHGCSLRYPLIRFNERQAFRLANQIEVPTAELRDWIISNYHLAPNKVAIWPNFVDTELYKPDGTNAQAMSVIFVGRLVEVKNLNLLLESCAKAKVKLLTICGDGPLRQTLEVLAQKLGVKIEFKGVISNNELPIALRQSSVFVSCSRREGHPKALFEAMSCGLAVVGGRVPGISEAIYHGETGLLCDYTVDGFSTAITKLFQDEPLRLRLSRRAREWVVNQLSFRELFDREEKLLLDLINNSQVSSRASLRKSELDL